MTNKIPEEDSKVYGGLSFGVLVWLFFFPVLFKLQYFKTKTLGLRFLIYRSLSCWRGQPDIPSDIQTGTQLRSRNYLLWSPNISMERGRPQWANLIPRLFPGTAKTHSLQVVLTNVSFCDDTSPLPCTSVFAALSWHTRSLPSAIICSEDSNIRKNLQLFLTLETIKLKSRVFCFILILM